MKANQIAQELACKVGLTQIEATLAVNTIFNTIAKSLGEGEEVGIHGFGSFKIQKRKPREVALPNGGTAPLKNVNRIYFRPSKNLKHKANKEA